MTQLSPFVFLVDVDNTLIDNDQIVADLNRHLIEDFGAERHQRYWTIFEERRAKYGYADYLGTLQHYRMEHPYDPHLLRLSFFFVDYPFAKRLFPEALNVMAYLGSIGQCVILSDGDMVFQPRKIQQSGLFDAVDGRVLIYINKERELGSVETHYPACHYIMVDDKLNILTAVKKIWGERVTTIFIRKGHYAFDTKILGRCPPADLTIDQIEELQELDLSVFFPAAQQRVLRPHFGD